jgi:hypothetical protein
VFDYGYLHELEGTFVGGVLQKKFSCEVLDGQVVDDRYWVLDDVILYKDQIYLVPESTLKGNILKVCHDSPTTGHQGYLKTYRKSGRDSHGRVSRMMY